MYTYLGHECQTGGELLSPLSKQSQGPVISQVFLPVLWPMHRHKVHTLDLTDL